MLRKSFSLAVVVLVAIFFAQQLLAGPLTSAEITKIINRVSVIDPATGDHPAAIRDVIKDDLALETGVKSRSELLFQDNTLTRIGPETFFSFRTGTRDMTLEKGSMLLQVPKGLGGAKIHTAAVTAAITGTTIMMEYVPNQYIKVLVLEGSLRLSRNGAFGDSLVLRPGKMVIMRPNAKKIPDPIDVDLEHIVKTSTLVNFPDGKPLPSVALIQDAIDHQQTQLAAKDLAPTNLVMGHGTNVLVTSNNPLIGSIAPNGILGGTPAGVSDANAKVGAVVLPLVGNVSTTLGNTTTGVTDLLGSTTSTVGGVASNLLGTTSTLVSIPLSSSSQLLSLVNTAVPNVVGALTVTPVINSITATVATVPAAVPVSSVTTTVTAATSNISSAVNTVATLPTTLTSVSLASPNSKPSALPLGLGH
jgi:hypothetical protein